MPMRNSYPLILWHGGVLLGHAALEFNGTACCTDGAGKLDQNAVAGGLYYPSSVGGDNWINKGLPERLESAQRAFFVRTHQAAVSGNIRR